MAKAFSLASWNVEHFKNVDSRVGRVIDYLNDPVGGNEPDVFALYEVEGKEVYDELVEKMPGYSFHITEGPQVQEIMVGVKKGFTSFFTQKTEFKSGNSLLRPGALLSLRVGAEDYTILSLHTKSSNKPVGLGLRDDMFTKAVEFRRKLEKVTDMAQWDSNYLFLGDLNTMGMKYLFGLNVDAPTELKKLDLEAKKKKMARLNKSAPATWSNGSASSIPPSDLDHVVASEHLDFKPFAGARVSVRGWVEEPTPAKQDAWIRKYSDHALLYMEVQKV